MYGDKWWGYLHENGVVTITAQDPTFYPNWHIAMNTMKIVGPFEEDLADELEGNSKMVRRRIMAALFDKPIDFEGAT